ncbi:MULTISPECIES: hypothetical protein [Streptomyces]|uniref:Uncharacterized protein n=1 Tax=Streptomyces harbinensis TaxID=1176198 RepID=A0A1I6WCX5_9ACTN|nr:MULTISPECIES: hypothetical protein [Streptomyces]SFT23846.1 hypothetical protein SAMN05444716_1214 [Streptomyces harbinensis]
MSGDQHIATLTGALATAFHLIRLQAEHAAGLTRQNTAQQDALQQAVRELEFQAGRAALTDPDQSARLLNAAHDIVSALTPRPIPNP